jgi:hypothetical protein
VLLSLFGPEPYPFAYSREEDHLYPPMDNKNSMPKCVELQPLSADRLVLSKEFHCNEDGLLRTNGIFNANDPLLTDSSHLSSQNKQI